MANLGLWCNMLHIESTASTFQETEWYREIKVTHEIIIWKSVETNENKLIERDEQNIDTIPPPLDVICCNIIALI